MAPVGDFADALLNPEEHDSDQEHRDRDDGYQDDDYPKRSAVVRAVGRVQDISLPQLAKTGPSDRCMRRNLALLCRLVWRMRR
jgi:hypothetical protein